MAGALLLAHVAAAQISGDPPTIKPQWIKPSLIGLPPARTSGMMAYDPAMGATVLYGGTTYGAIYGDTWSFSKAGWTQLKPAMSPPPLQAASIAYDPMTETVVLFGGLNVRVGASGGTFSNQTWTWDGTTWTQQFPSVSPSARSWNTNAMAYDTKLGKVVLFGGQASFVFTSETWEWDGTSKTWTQQFPTHSPSPRTATLAYDYAAEQVVLFGGNTNGIAYNDTWTYTGVDWIHHQPATVPQTRTDNGLAFDPFLKGVVLFGGLAGSCEDCGEGRLNDTWLWDGQNWNQVQTAVSPTPSSGASFTYDGTSRGMLLFGGWIGDFQFTNSTWIFMAF